MSRIYEGCGTRNWCLHAAEGRFFVKEYPGQINVDEERQALDLARYARDCGIPTPRVIATRSENLICTSGDTTFVLFEWADGCTAKPSLALEHYTRPVELQEALDRFWFQRAHAAQTLFANLGTAQAILRSVWETSAGDGRTR